MVPVGQGFISKNDYTNYSISYWKPKQGIKYTADVFISSCL